MIENNQNKSNVRGGKRVGAGRKKGAATKRTRQIADKAAEQGITPLEVMLQTMAALMQKADELKKAKLKPGEKPTVTPLEMMIEAASVAKDAAPYMHPRLAAMELSGKDGKPVAFISNNNITPEQLAEAVKSVREKF